MKYGSGQKTFLVLCNFVDTHTHIIYIYAFTVIYLLGHNVKCIPSCGSKSENVRPSHYGVILVYRYLNAFAPIHLPLFQMTQITRQ